MSERVTPEELRALGGDSNLTHFSWVHAAAKALRAAADTIEALTAERDTLRATVERMDRVHRDGSQAWARSVIALTAERDDAVALLRTFQNAMAECEGYPEDTNEWQDVDAFLARTEGGER